MSDRDARVDQASPLDAVLPVLCVVALLAGEAGLIPNGRLPVGGISDAVLLFLMLQAGPWPSRRETVLLSDRARKAILGLTLVPLIRVVALGLPLRDGSVETGTLATAVLLGSAALALAPAVGLPRRRILEIRCRSPHLRT